MPGRTTVSGGRFRAPRGMVRSRLGVCRGGAPPFSLVVPTATRKDTGVAGDSGVGNARLLSSVQALRSAVSDASLPLDLPVGAGRAARARPPARPARRLRHPAADVARRPAARRRRRLDRRRQVDARQLGRRARGDACPASCGRPPARRCWSTTRTTPPGSPARASCPTWPASPGGTQSSDGPGAVRLVSTDEVAAGLALLDAPDIDRVVEANRDLARPAARRRRPLALRHDGRPLRRRRPVGAAARGRRSAAPLSPSSSTAFRRRPSTRSARTSRRCCASRGSTRRRSSRSSSRAAPTGCCPPTQIERLRGWLAALAGDAAGPRRRRAADPPRGPGLPRHAAPRRSSSRPSSRPAAGGALVDAAAAAYDEAQTPVHAGMLDGTLLRGEVLARWQEFVGTGEFFRQVESTVSPGARPVHVASSRASRPEPTTSARRSSPASSPSSSTAPSCAAERDRVAPGARLPGGDQLLTADPALARSGDGPSTAGAERLVRDWQGDILQMVRDEGRDRRTTARIMAYGVNGLGVVLMLVTFASTGGHHRRRGRHRRRHRRRRPEAARGRLRRPGRPRARPQGPRAADRARRRAVCRRARPLRRSCHDVARRHRPDRAPRPRPLRPSRPRDEPDQDGPRQGGDGLGGRAGHRARPSCRWRWCRARTSSTPRAVEVARRVVDKAVERSGIAGDHTVVALAGCDGQRQVLALQRPRRRRRRRHRRTAADDVSPDGRALGRRRRVRAARLARGGRPSRRRDGDRVTGRGRRRLARRPGRRFARRARAPRPARTSTPASSITVGRPSGCSSSSTSSSG